MRTLRICSSPVSFDLLHRGRRLAARVQSKGFWPRCAGTVVGLTCARDSSVVAVGCYVGHSFSFAGLWVCQPRFLCDLREYATMFLPIMACLMPSSWCFVLFGGRSVVQRAICRSRREKSKLESVS